jgi:hypothetical protein
MKDPSRQIDRYLEGSLEDNEVAELFAWLAESPEHAEVFARQSLLDQHLAELLCGGFVEPLEAKETGGNPAPMPPAQVPSRPPQGDVRATPAGPDPSVKAGIVHPADAAAEHATGSETVRLSARSWRRFRRLVWAGGVAAAFLIVFSLVIAWLRSNEVAELRRALELARQDTATAGTEEAAIINFYAREHQDVVARLASLSPPDPEPMRMRVNQDDILYYELLDDQSEYTHPGIIVRGPVSQGQISSPKTPLAANGHTLSLSEAKEAAAFDLVAPPWLHPYYRLEQIRTIEDRDALQLLYTNGITSISLFEQPLDGRRRLEPEHFREYAVYRKEGQSGAVLLAWRDSVLSYVLVGNVELSQLMDMAQSIRAAR